MATPQLSPGVLVREVDLTVGRAENVLDNIGAIAGPFPIGPVDEPYLIRTQQELINVFGKPLSTDRQYEYWMSASSFLTYGGILKVVRTSGSTLNNANAGVNTTSDSTLLIKNKDDYELNFQTSTDFTYASRNPGKWANNLKVCFIDNVSDQTIGITTNNLGDAGVRVGLAVTAPKTSLTIPGDGTTSTFTGHLRGIVTGIRTDAVNSESTFDVKVLERVLPDTVSYNLKLNTNVSLAITAQSGVPNGIGTDIVYMDSVAGIEAGDVINLEPGVADSGQLNNPIISVGGTFVQVATAIGGTIAKAPANTVSIAVTAGQVSSGFTTVFIENSGGNLDSVEVGDYFTGAGLNQALITGVGNTFVTLSVGVAATATVGAAVTVQAVGVKQNSVVLVSGVTTTAGTVTPVTYQEYNSAASFVAGDSVYFENENGTISGSNDGRTVTTAVDWYDQQTLGLTNSTVYWKNIAPRPLSSNYVTSRNGTNDSLHVAVVDDTGDVTGIQGNVLEKHLFLSKALDGARDGENPLKTYYKEWITNNSSHIFVGYNPSQREDTNWVLLLPLLISQLATLL